MLAQGLSALIRPLLSCDPKVAAAITAVGQASDARIAAISAYFLEASRQTGLQTASARRLLASVQPLGSDLAAEKADLVREQLDVSGQIAALSESGQRRPSFNGAQDALRQISALEQQRASAADSGISHDDAAWAAARSLLSKLEAREAALQDAQAAFEAESSSWRAYYAARLVRAQTECQVTKGVIAPVQPQGKQK